MTEPLPPDDARQGRGGRTLLIILICAFVLAAVVWWGVEWYGETIDADQKVELQKSTDAPETPTGTVTSGQKPAETGTTPPAN